jgi:hypothetical protein
MQPTTKSVFASKTMAVNAVVLIASFIPSVRDWVQAHPETTMQVLAGAGVLLRWISKGKVNLVGNG